MAGRYSSNLKQCDSLTTELANALGTEMDPGFLLVETAERDCDSTPKTGIKWAARWMKPEQEIG